MCADFPFTAVIQRGDRWLRFSQPERVLAAATREDVLPTLRRVVEAVEKEGLHAAGYIAYEAAPGFDRALTVRGPATLPLLWFGLYRSPEVWRQLPAGGAYTLGDWQPSQQLDGYRQAIAQHQGGHRPRRHLSGQLHHCAACGLARRSVGAVRGPGQRPARRLCGLHRLGTARHLLGLAGAVPGHRRRSGGLEAHEGHRAARPHPGRGSPARRCAARLGQGSGRERHDRRHDPQRPGADRPLRQRARAQPAGGGALPHPPADDLHRRGRAATRRWTPSWRRSSPARPSPARPRCAPCS